MAGDGGRAGLLALDAVRINPVYLRGWYNLGTMRLEAGDHAAAVAAFQRVLAGNPQDVDTLYNLALALSRQGKEAAAAHYYHRALAQAPGDSDILYNLGLLYRRMGRYAEARRLLERVVAEAPDHGPAHGHLATLALKLGDYPRAIAGFERLLALGHRPEAARHLLAALQGEAPAAPPAEYVSGLFDQYADRFEEELMEGLGYRVPFLLAELLREFRGERMYEDLLDLGCGTGLAGEAFLSYAARLHGVDLSAGMLAVAAEKEVYDRLRQDELLHFCRSDRGTYDLITAADVLNYLGDLRPFFQAVLRVLQPGGELLFSLEEGPEEDFSLTPSGRYAHAAAYPERLAAEVGLELVARRRTGLRREGGDWLQGNLYFFQRPPVS